MGKRSPRVRFWGSRLGGGGGSFFGGSFFGAGFFGAGFFEDDDFCVCEEGILMDLEKG